MEIVGNGFLARGLRPIAARHEDTVVVAAGVSWASGTSAADFAREAALLRRVADDCAATGRRLLFFSTSSTGMYGLAKAPAREDAPVTPCTPYGRHKLSLEEQLKASGAPYLILRLGHLVGPDQPPHQLLPVLLRQVREGVVRIHRNAARDLLAVDDAVTVIDRLLARGVCGETVNLASGHAVPVERIVDHLARRLGTAVRREYQESRAAQHVISVEKLYALVPEVAGLGFGPGYYRRVLDEFLPDDSIPAQGDPGTLRYRPTTPAQRSQQ
ncbi:NAD-dependent epimerase/dehydratase [Streptomyces sp. WAC 01529]|uniref:NAD-dependent epimerase/dehydratase family protein n=1 Tax=Streptomyces sp. WAC 01529 TaxID=2203205 RepID=UPI000F6EC1CC|nr:NAD-dependent epimerase/dehydratase family protein [Streptomyces sp. WAC 01529]AZM55042.1 NAD-dependent epimerase/dehydratase [Streptomyces sp. WAC 01529]